MISAESFNTSVIRTKDYKYTFDPLYEKLLSGTYGVPELCKDIMRISKSKLCTVVLAKVDNVGDTRYIEAYTTDPTLSLCKDSPLYTRAIETKKIIVSNNAREDPRGSTSKSCPMKTLCAIPIISNDIVYGQILLANKKNPYSHKTIERIEHHLNMLCGIIISREEKATFDRDKSGYDQFLSSVSHEIKTPIHSIVNMTNLLHEVKDDDKMFDEYVRRIMSSCEDLVGTVTDAIDYQRLKSGSVGVVNDTFNLEELLSNTINLIRYKIDSKGLRLHLRVDDDVPRLVYGDAPKIKRILINLIINAIKYTDAGSIDIGVQNKAGYVMLWVKDTGCGIPKAHIYKIFDEYYQVNPTYNSGMGLGLSLCRTMVQMMGGDITVVSSVEPPTGSKFTITLPLAPETYSIEDLSDEDHSLSILVVDSNETSRIHLREYCNQWKVNVEVASSFKEAKRLVRYKTNFDIFMIDASKDLGEAITFLRIIENNFPKSRIIALNSGKAIEGFDASLPSTNNKSDVYNLLISLKNSKKGLVRKRLTSSGDLSVCIVEDDDNSAYALKQVLISCGISDHNITIVDSGEQAVRIVTHSHFDLVFIDCRLKGKMDGITATRLIKKQVALLRVYGVSAELSDEEKTKWLDSGLEGLLMKPFESDAIRTIMDSM